MSHATSHLRYELAVAMARSWTTCDSVPCVRTTGLAWYPGSYNRNHHRQPHHNCRRCSLRRRFGSHRTRAASVELPTWPIQLHPNRFGPNDWRPRRRWHRAQRRRHRGRQARGNASVPVLAHDRLGGCILISVGKMPEMLDEIMLIETATSSMHPMLTTIQKLNIEGNILDGGVIINI